MRDSVNERLNQCKKEQPCPIGNRRTEYTSRLSLQGIQHEQHFH